jgi:AIPR protein
VGGSWVTIVAKEVRSTGDKFTIEDYQIVNGCQTSFVLHECRDEVLSDEGVLVPIRLIATRNEEVKNSIIKATNRQTEVTEEQLFALTDFPKKLEAFFPSFDGKKKLFYERRPKQYAASDTVEKVRVVGMTAVVRAFASMFLEKPHGTTRNYKNLLKQIGTEIFHKDHILEPYYAAAYAHYRLEFLFRRQLLPADLKPARYHLLLGARYKITRQALPRLNSHDMRRYCEVLLNDLWDDTRSTEIFQAAAEDVRRIARDKLHRDNIRTEDFTKNLLSRQSRKFRFPAK